MHIFVLGTGRSGTHWVGNILASHPEIRTTIEKKPIFQLATQAALRPRRRPALLPVLRALYTFEELRSRPRHYADKSHPIIWYADRVAQWFPEAKFIAIERNPYATIASMLRHSGVNRWHREWNRYGVPNPFLGIDDSNADVYGQLSLAEKASLRWLSHHRQTSVLRGTLRGRMIVIDYDRLFANFDDQVGMLWEFLGVSKNEQKLPTPNRRSRDSWRQVLSERDILNIERITGVSPAP